MNETEASSLEQPPVVEPAEPVQKQPALPRGWWGLLRSMMNWMFGAVTILVGLSVMSVLPLLNLLSLGYLLQASGNVARSGRIRDGFIGMRQAAVIGRMVVGAWVVFWPARVVSEIWRDSQLIAAESVGTQVWHVVAIVLTVLTVCHVVWACLRGGRLRDFIWPAPVRFCRWLVQPGKYRNLRDAVWNYVVGLRLPHYFWLGLQGFIGAIIWLIVPVGIMILASSLPPDGGAPLSFLGAFLLMGVVIYLPFLQVNFALTRRFSALFEVRTVRHLFRRAPIAFWIALFITLLFALPLYLLKIELTPQEVAWLPSLVFVGFIFPARLLAGWAVSRGRRREKKRALIFRWISRGAAVPVVGLYVFFVYLTQYLSWNGTLSLLEQHAFLIPAPLFNL